MSATIKQLRAFVAVASSQSLAEASAQLHISQPALSVAIRNLEDAAGGQLFNRDSRQLNLTPEGSEFLTRARQLIRHWDSTFGAVQQRFALETGQLQIGAIPAFALNRLPDLLARFHGRHPQINIVIEDIVMERLQAAVRDGRVELGISFRPDDLGSLEFLPLEQDRFVAVLPAQHPLASRKSLDWSALADTPFIAMNRGSAVRRWTDAAFAACGAQVRLLCEASQLSTIGRLVKTGMGASAVPQLCETQMREYGLVTLPLSTPEVGGEVGILLRGRSALSAPATAFLEMLTE